MTGEMNGAGDEDWLASVKATASQELARLEQGRVAVAAQLRAVDDEIKRARTILRAIDPSETSPTKVKPRTMNHPGSSKTQRQVAREVLALTETAEFFTALDTKDRVEVSDPVVYGVFNHLRSEGLIGKAHKDPGNKRQSWRVLDRERLEQMVSDG